jgi:hypothetical protein
MRDTSGVKQLRDNPTVCSISSVLTGLNSVPLLSRRCNAERISSATSGTVLMFVYSWDRSLVSN